MKLAIGITGHPLAGKETAANRIAERAKMDGRTVSYHRFSDILRDTLDLWGMAHGRDPEQKLAQVMELMAEGTLSRAMKHRLAKDPADIGILDGVRWYSDENMIREFPKEGIASLLLYITADLDTRFTRLVKRGRSGEQMTTREEFERQNQQKNEIYISDIGSRADAKILNNYDSLDGLIAAIDAVYDERIKSAL